MNYLTTKNPEEEVILYLFSDMLIITAFHENTNDKEDVKKYIYLDKESYV